ncbi:MAG: zeta toxin [Bacteroidetes bacterium GWA2_31_9]|nr:MAG: zeta toxin [Bacteroidetes bacterium GWA2_31_9]
MPNLYIIAGCNGAGKTTASYTVLPEMLNCKEFVNADEIARGLSPFQPEKVAIESGRIMLNRINDLLNQEVDFSFETTLSAKSFVNLIKEAHGKGYFITLIFFWLNSKELAIERVKTRVSEGGHNIPVDTIKKRYDAGIKNLFELYIPVCDYWLLIDSSKSPYYTIAKGEYVEKLDVININNWNKINEQKGKK